MLIFLDDTDIILINSQIAADLKDTNTISLETLSELKTYIDARIEIGLHKYAAYPMFGRLVSHFTSIRDQYTYDTLLPQLVINYTNIKDTLIDLDVDFYSKLTAYFVINSKVAPVSEAMFERIKECVSKVDTIDINTFKLICKKELLRRCLSTSNVDAQELRALSDEVKALLPIVQEEEQILAEKVRIGW